MIAFFNVGQLGNPAYRDRLPEALAIIRFALIMRIVLALIYRISVQFHSTMPRHVLWIMAVCNSHCLLYNTHETVNLYTRQEADMRTNIVLDDKLVERAQKLTGIKTKREVVHEALRTLILLSEQAEIRNLRGKLKWEGNLHEQRLSRVGK